MENSPASGEFIPQTNTLPEQYAHFNEIDSFTKKLRSLGDTTFYEQAYQTLWVGLCMQMDKKEQASLMSGLKEVAKEKDKNTHPENITAYWQTLQATSVYPVFEKTKRQLEMENSAKKTIELWQPSTDLEQYSDMGDPNSQPRLAGEAAKIYPYIWDRDLIGESFGDIKNRGRIVTSKAIYESLSAFGGSQELREYLASLQLLQGARSLSKKLLLDQIHLFDQVNKGELSLHIPDIETKFAQLLKKIEPYHQTAISLATAIHAKEQELFGEDADVASTLWASALFLRGTRLPNKVTIQSIRDRIMEKLIQKDYMGAKFEVEEIIAKYPSVLPEFVEQRLGIDPDLLRELTQDPHTNPEMPINKQKQAKEERQNAISQLKPLFGKELVSADGKLRITITATGERDDGSYSFIGISQDSDMQKILGRKSLGVIRPVDICTIIELFGLKPIN